MLCKWTFNSYTMGMSGLPDIYTPEGQGLRVYIRRITSADGITIICIMVRGWIKGFCHGITTIPHSGW